MPEPAGGFIPYVVSYSGRVQEELADLIGRARARGRHEAFLSAAKAIVDRLRVYPQFGEPLREAAQEWIGVVPPLVVRYVIYEERRLVWVVKPIQPLPRSGLS